MILMKFSQMLHAKKKCKKKKSVDGATRFLLSLGAVNIILQF